MFTWYWLADLCAAEGITFVLGHALSMKAIHGGKAKNDKIDSHKIARLLRGGMLPQAYVYPAAMRATRDLMRRRLHLVRKRGQLLAHIQNTRASTTCRPSGEALTYPTNRDGVVEHFPDPSVRKSIEVDLALIDQYDALVIDLELTIVREAKRHDADAFHRLRSVPGIGKVLALTILYEIHDITRFDRVQEFASYARLVKCVQQSAREDARHRRGKMGNVHLKWAFSEAAVLFLRHTEAEEADREDREEARQRARRCRSSPTRSGGRCFTCCRAERSSRWRSSSRRSGEGSGRARRLTRARQDRARHRSGRTRAPQSATSRRSGAKGPAASRLDGTPALSLATHPRSRDGLPLPRAWRQRTRSGDVARHEEAGMRARMSF